MMERVNRGNGKLWRAVESEGGWGIRRALGNGREGSDGGEW